ncbi:hypothetical protein BH23ACT12_BH23ACT12_16640 [soil metagenome]
MRPNWALLSIAALILVVWLAGLLLRIAGGLIHIALVVALVVAAVSFVRARVGD